ncbi:MAG TPA: hypothetical protein VNB94_00415 [Mycobacteriales bacterium]|nr:hypothetical protein [Mycobacteriales bacterium]
MKHGLLVVVIGLALVVGCGDGDSTQSLAAQVPEECRAGWTEYPGPDGEDARRCQEFFRDHPEIAASIFPTSRPAPAGSAAFTVSPTDGTAPAATTAPRTTSSSPASARQPPTPPPASASPASAQSSSPRPPDPSRSPAPRATSTTAPTPSPRKAQAPLLITEEDNGKTFEISRATSDAVLRLGGSFYNWSQPTLEGASIRLNQRQFVRDPGFSEWEIEPVSSGTTVVRSSGDPKCRDAEPPCGAPSTLFEVRIIVG